MCFLHLPLLYVMVTCELFAVGHRGLKSKDFINQMPEEDGSLLKVASVANSCPGLEAFLIKLLWISPIKRRRDVRRCATRPHEHQKLLEIHGYYGRGSDLELVAYFIDNAVALKEILIDPRCQARKGTPTSMRFSNMNEKVARYSLQSITPRGVKLVIL
ncbi:hypothetical protein Lser_V15G44105 [Lactuca serriola]